MRQTLRRAAPLVGLILALAPFSAFADGNDDVINANKALQVWLNNMTPMQQGVAHGQMEIADAIAIAKMVYYEPNAQTEIPNAKEMYNEFCSAAIQQMQAKMANGNALAMARPWDPHAQAEAANGKAMYRQLWDVIGDTYPGNPFYNAGAKIADDGAVYADDGTDMVAGDDAVVADDAIVADDEAVVADDAVDATAAE